MPWLALPFTSSLKAREQKLAKQFQAEMLLKKVTH